MQENMGTYVAIKQRRERKMKTWSQRHSDVQQNGKYETRFNFQMIENRIESMLTCMHGLKNQRINSI